MVGDVISDDAFRAAANCPTCEVLTKRPLHLNETGVSAMSAKLLANGFARSVTLLSDGSMADERSLIAAEHVAERTRYGI